MKGVRIFKRKAIHAEKDPYLSKFKKSGPENNAVCRKCGLYYHDKKWAYAHELPKGLLARPEGEFKQVLCPACQKILDKYPEGYLTIQGDFLKEHRTEILNLLHNKEEITSHNNPIERIIEIKDAADTIEVTTTTDKFAQMIGRMLNKAFDGTVEYKWGDNEKITRVVWTR